jgi:N-acyl-D-aspartate/D-glutamate deacylase
VIALLFSLCLCVLAPDEPPVAADLVIRGATLYDGSGSPGRTGDVAIKGDRIVGVGSVAAQGQPRVIDGKGLVVTPGFIDLHTHCDYPLQNESTRDNRNYLTQGVTTVVTGNCGSGPYDVAAYFEKLEKGGIGTNVIHQAPHNDIRAKVMGNVNRSPTPEELEKMKVLVDKAMSDGAWSLSTGLIYNPGTYSKTDEIIELAKIAAKHGGFYASHIRDEGLGLLDSVNEVLKIARDAKIPVHISHIKASGRRAWGKSSEAIALIEQARAAGLAVTADQYPYVASSTSLAATVIPTQFREGSKSDYQARLADAEQRARIRNGVEQALEGRQGGRSIQIARYAPNPAWQGKNLEQIAELEKKPAVDLVLEIEEKGGAAIVNFGMSEDDVRLYMGRPWVATASDGSGQVPGNTVPHPRSYGCFPRKIGFYALKEKALPLEQSLRSCNGLPAEILHLPERGYLKAGYIADVVVFDPQAFIDKATYDKPHQYAAGVKYLFVNGVLAIDNEKFQGKLAGKVLRHEEAKAQ